MRLKPPKTDYAIKRMTSVLISNSVGGGFGFQLIELAHLKLKD